MAYTPISVDVYIAAYAGCLAGIVGERFLTDQVSIDYDHEAKVAGAFAQEFDTVYNKPAPTTLELTNLQSVAALYWNNRLSVNFTAKAAALIGGVAGPDFELPATYLNECLAIIALLAQADAFYAAGITPSPTSFGQYSFDSILLSGKKFNDVSAAYLATIPTGQLIWINSVRDYWFWDANNSSASNPANQGIFNPAINVGKVGRLVRMNIPSPTWTFTNTTWVVRPSTGNFENTGLSDTSPLDGTGELERRLGGASGMKMEFQPKVYHMYFPEGTGNVTGNNQRFRISGCRTQTAQGADAPTTLTTQIVVHGAAPGSEGQGIFFAGPFTVSAVTAEAHPTNVQLQVASAGIAGSWTAAALLNVTGNNVSKRCRVTTAGPGGQVGATWFPIEDLGNLLGGNPTAACVDACVPNNYLAVPVTILTTAYTPVVGDIFVVETLNNFNQIIWDTDATLTVICESIQHAPIEAHFSNVAFDKCSITSTAQVNISGMMSRLRMNGCRFSGPTSTRDTCFTALMYELTNCNWQGGWLLRCEDYGFITNGIISDLSGSLMIDSGAHPFANTSSARPSGWNVNNLGIFNVPNTLPFVIAGKVAYTATTEIWGIGNSFAPTALLAGAELLWLAATTAGGVPPASFFYIDCNVASWIVCDSALVAQSVPAYDDTTSTWTAPRSLTKANIQATIAAGGFNGRFVDPLTKCAMIAAQQS